MEEHDKPELGSGRSVRDAFFLYAASFALMVVVVLLLGDKSMTLRIIVLGMVCMLLPAIRYIQGEGLDLAESLRLRATRPAFLWRAGLLGALSFAPTSMIFHFVSKLLGDAPVVQQQPWLTASSAVDFPLFVFCFSLVPGVTEEVFFRGALQGRLEKKGPWFGVAVTAVLFSLFHGLLWHAPSLFVVGLVMGFLVLRTGSLYPAITFHICMNATGLAARFMDWRIPWIVALPALVIFLTLLRDFRRMTEGLDPKPSPLSRL